MVKPVGWQREPARHSLAAKGVKTRTLHGTTRGLSRNNNIYDVFWKHHCKSYDRKENADLLEKMRHDFFVFDNLPVKDAIETINQNVGIIDMKEGQGDSPDNFTMLRIVDLHHGVLEGYVVPPESGRDDARISFTGFTIPASRDNAERMRKMYRPDEFDETTPRHFRFWWD